MRAGPVFACMRQVLVTRGNIMSSLPETYTDFFIAYWPCEGAAPPLRLGREQALAVWSSPADVQNYGRLAVV